MRNHNPYLNSIKLSLMLHYVILFNNQIFGDTIKLKRSLNILLGPTNLPLRFKKRIPQHFIACPCCSGRKVKLVFRTMTGPRIGQKTVMLTAHSSRGGFKKILSSFDVNRTLLNKLTFVLLFRNYYFVVLNRFGVA